MGMKILRCWCSNPTGCKLFAEINFPLLRNNTKLTTLSTLYNYGKTPFDHSPVWCFAEKVAKLGLHGVGSIHSLVSMCYSSFLFETPVVGIISIFVKLQMEIN